MNFDMTRQHAHGHHQLLIYSCAEDTYRGVRLTGRNRRNFLPAPDTKENTLCGILPLSIGMRVIFNTQYLHQRRLSKWRTRHSSANCLRPRYSRPLHGRETGAYEGLPKTMFQSILSNMIVCIPSGGAMEQKYKENSNVTSSILPQDLHSPIIKVKGEFYKKLL